MNRREVRDGWPDPITHEKVFKCDPCGFLFAVRINEEGCNAEGIATAWEHEVSALDRSWCPCMSWNIQQVQVGMRLPEGWVISIDRVAGTLLLAESLGASHCTRRIVPFAEVSPPQ